MPGLAELQDAIDTLEEAEIHRRAFDRFVIEREESDLGSFERIRGLPSDARMRVSLERHARSRQHMWIIWRATAPRISRRERNRRRAR